MKWIWNVGMSIITWGNPYNKWQYDKSMIKKACELRYPSGTDTQCRWFYQMFWGWYYPRTDKFESRTCLVQHDGGQNQAKVHHK